MKLECPVCGGALQGTVLVSVDVTARGVEIVALDDNPQDCRWYCANDHELPAELADHLRLHHLGLHTTTVYKP